MSQAKVTKEDVARIKAQLIGEGKKPTIQAIRVALGNQGSMTTIQQLKAELDEEELAAKDSPAALQAFREMWALGVREGRAQMDVQVQDLKETIQAVSAEATRLEGEAIASRAQAEASARKLEETVVRLNGANEEISKVREASERYAARLAEVGELHSAELKRLHGQAEEAGRQHALEMRELRARAEKASEEHRESTKELRARMEKTEVQHNLEVARLLDQAAAMGQQHRDEIDKLREQAEHAEERHREEAGNLRKQVDEEKDRANELEVKLARAEALLEMAGEAKAPVESLLTKR